MPNYKGYENPDLVVSVEEARKKVNHPDTIFVDTRNYWKYAKGHIPGAFNLELYAFHWIDTSSDGTKAFVKQMNMLFGSLGVGKDTEVIFYQNNSGYDAARGVWLLDFLGYGRGELLDGGFNMWKRKNYPTSTEDPESRKRKSHSTNETNYDVFADKNSLLSSLGKSSFQIVDSRSRGEFDSTFHRGRKAGHIPSAVNLEWKIALRRDGSLKSSEQLRKIYAPLNRNSSTITYCQSGYRAAHSWLVLKLLGFDNVKNYLGSWYEWSNDDKTPVKKKDNPAKMRN